MHVEITHFINMFLLSNVFWFELLRIISIPCKCHSLQTVIDVASYIPNIKLKCCFSTKYVLNRRKK